MIVAKRVILFFLCMFLSIELNAVNEIPKPEDYFSHFKEINVNLRAICTDGIHTIEVELLNTEKDIMYLAGMLGIHELNLLFPYVLNFKDIETGEMMPYDGIIAEIDFDVEKEVLKKGEMLSFALKFNNKSYLLQPERDYEIIYKSYFYEYGIVFSGSEIVKACENKKSHCNHEESKVSEHKN